MGELWLWYALSQVCFVGGSLNQPGAGHNILEPMALYVPTVITRIILLFKNIVDECVAEQAIDIAPDAQAAVAAFRHYLYDQEAAKHMAAQAQRVLARNQGVITTSYRCNRPLSGSTGDECMNIVLLEPEDVQETLWVIHQPSKNLIRKILS